MGKWLLTAAILAGPVSAAQRPVLHVACFVPTDRQPIPGYVERIDRVMTAVREFYARGMEQNGYGKLTFDLDREPDGTLRVIMARAKGPMAEYGRDAAGKVYDEVRPMLLAAGLAPERTHVIIFQLLLDWRDGKAVELGPFVGGGAAASGTCWVYDDALLDPRRLASQEPGGYYVRACSIGEFNSHYLGGVAHELGHALGLPHDAEQSPGPGVPHSLMGYGNHTYGQDLRGEGPGTVVSPASAMALAHHPLFTGQPAEPGADPRCAVEDLAFDWSVGKLTVSGKAAAASPVYGVVAYHDPDQPPADYDAVGWVAPVAPNGAFRVSLAQLKPGKAQLRLRFCQADGTATTLPFAYVVDAQGAPDLAALWSAAVQSRAVRAWQAGDRAGLTAALAAAHERAPGDADLAHRLDLLTRLLDLPRPVSPRSVPAGTTEVAVSDLAFAEARVGWGRPLRDQVLLEGPDPFLSLGGRLYDKGLFAHAPSLYRLSLGGGWRRLRSGFGLNDGHDGSVAFVVRGDGRELFRSELIRDHARHDLDLSVAGVDDLELVVEDGGDGANSDWGIWVEPVLRR